MSAVTTTKTAVTKKLGLLGAVAISLAMISPSMSVSLNPQAMAEQVGAAVTITYILALMPLLLIAYSFMVLTNHYGGSGSLFGLVGRVIGPRAGTMGGLWLIVTYMSAVATTTSAFGIFMVTTLEQIFGVTYPNWLALLFMAIGLLIAHGIALRDVKPLSRWLLVVEGVTMTLILFVCVVVLWTLLTTGGPQGQRPTSAVFDLNGVSTTALGIALTFGVLSSVGFEGSAAVSSETNQPKRTIPRALLLTALLSSLFFIVVSTIAVWGFGTTPNELTTFEASGSLPSDLADTYVGEGFGIVISLGAAASAFACMIAAQVAGARILRSFGEHDVLPHRFAKTSKKHEGIPVFGTLVMALGALALMVLAGLGVQWDAFNLFVLVSDFTGIVILAAYALAAIAAATMFVKAGGAKALFVILPILAVLCVLVIFVLSVVPLPAGWEAYAPIAAMLAIIVLFGVGLATGKKAVFSDES